MLNLTTKSTTKFGLLVTSIVLLGACSAKQVKQEAQEFQTTPEPIVEENYNQTTPVPEYQASTPEVEPSTYTPPVKSHKITKKKKKVKHASVKTKKSKRSHKVAKNHKRQETKQAAVAQIENTLPPTNGGGGYVPPVMEQAQAPVIPPPPFMEQAPVETDSSGRIGMWATVLAAALVLCGLAYRVRRGKSNQRRLVFNR